MVFEGFVFCKLQKRISQKAKPKFRLNTKFCQLSSYNEASEILFYKACFFGKKSYILVYIVFLQILYFQVLKQWFQRCPDLFKQSWRLQKYRGNGQIHLRKGRCIE